MSKLYKQYSDLKKADSNKLYLFKTGIFYTFLDEDAKLINSLIGLKLVKLNEAVVKCSFPISQLLKYSIIFKNFNLDYLIIDDLWHVSTSTNYLNNMKLLSFIKKFKTANIEYLSIRKAYDLIYEFKSIVDEIGDVNE